MVEGKEKEMTYEEYQKLYEEWKSTDSIKRKGEIEEQIYQVAYDLAKKMIGIYDKWGKKFVQDPDFSTERGCYSLDKEELDYDGKERVWLRYTDTWAYGGECDFGIDVHMKFLDEKNVQELEDQFLEDRIALLRKKIDESNAGIRILEESKLRYCVELNEKNRMKEKRDKEKERERKEAEENAWHERWHKQEEQAKKTEVNENA